MTGGDATTAETGRTPSPGFLTLPSPPHPRVHWCFTLRSGGVSRGAWGDRDGHGGLNLGTGCGDDPAAVDRNRAALAGAVGRPIRWLDQVHGTVVSDADDGAPPASGHPAADAQVTTRGGAALAILVADCLPVLLADRGGRVIGAAHAGWRGLAGGVVEMTVAAMRSRVPDADLVAWLGPSIGPAAFEVGDEVRQAFIGVNPADRSGFRAGPRDGKWFADLPTLAGRRLRRLGVDLSGGALADGVGFSECTVGDPQRYWSYRRDRRCGRMAALIWLAD